MSLGSIIYQLILSPLVLIFEFVYSIAFDILKSVGASIFPLSLLVNLLLLPFYNRADAIQEEERKRQEKMAPFAEHIKKTFKGDERYMMLQTLYKENNYKPIYALRSSIALILEVPFFIAAYTFLSNLSLLRGASFLFLSDLSQPDALLSVGSFSINLLPVLMTIINIISSEIYTRGFRFKDKITLHAMALLFLVLLYNSPSGLVLYWTLNNIFSLIKNIVSKCSDKKRAANIAFSIAGILIVIYGLFGAKTTLAKLYMLLVGVIFQVPLLTHSEKKQKCADEPDRTNDRLFLLGALFLSVFLGALIPSYVITASPSEFILLTSIHSPVRYIFYAFLTAAGAFVIWGGLFYYLASHKNRRRAAIGIWCFVAISSLNFLLFGKSESILSSDLQFETGLNSRSKTLLLNTLAIVFAIGVVILLYKKGRSFIRFMAPILLIVATGISGYNIYNINSKMPDIRRVAAQTTKNIPTVEFSKEGKNVVVIMMDRAISPLIPYIFQERPELVDQFSGFVWYPNTISFGFRTVVAAPALFGGYDYRPELINHRSEKTLVQEHDEALLTMPVIFSEAGYGVTVFDPPYAGYNYYPDLTIYDPYPGIQAYSTETGLFLDSEESDKSIQSLWKRNFFCYSLMKSTPMVLQPFLYTNGTYLAAESTDVAGQNSGNDSMHYFVSAAMLKSFVAPYNALKALPSITKAVNSGENRFFLMQNGTTHNVIPLQEPEYEPVEDVDNSEFDRTHTERFTFNGHTLNMTRQGQLTHYQCNMAAWIQLGNWMNYLKEIGVYDNTRIIIVADHGWAIDNDPDMQFLDGDTNTSVVNSKDASAYNPVLFVKDFGASGPYRTDYTFMTNADTPSLAMEGLIDDPVSPFTNNPIYQPEAKNAEKMYVMYTDSWDMNKSDHTFDPDGTNIWYSLNGQDLFNMQNWHEEDHEP